MTKIKSSQLVAGALFALCLATGPAEATVDHTYVSGKGTDTGGCVTPVTACRTFAYAIAQTSASGEIIVIDPANYSPVTITNSISIVADGGGPAGIVLPTGNAITINAGSAAVVNLRGLTLDGEGTAASGIVLNSAASLTISDCFARNFQNSGILLTPYPTLHIFSKVNISILNSVMNNNGTGLTVFGTGSGDTVVTVRKSVANYNVNGFSLSGVLLILADTMATGNTEYGILVAPITGDVTHSGVDSYGDNEINGNLTGDISGGTLSPWLNNEAD